MEIAHNLLKRKEHGGNRRIERSRQRGRAAHGHERLYVGNAQSKATSDHRSDARANLHRGTFAAERNSACERNRTAQEFTQHSPQRDVTVADEQRKLGLRDAAAARVREVSEQQKSTEKSACRGDENAAPCGAVGWIHA